jgi:hypothetical protein
MKAVTGAPPSAAMPLKTELSFSEKNNFRRAEVSHHAIADQFPRRSSIIF